MGVCNCSMFCCTLLYVPSSFAIILMGKRELVTLLSLSSWCLVIDVWLFLALPWVCLQFVIVVFPDHAHLLFFIVLDVKPSFRLLDACCYALHLKMKSQVVSAWYKMVNGTKDKICNKLYHVMHYLHVNDLFHSDWVNST